MRLLPIAITPPAAEPVTAAECKTDARIDGTEFDDALPVYITAAREMCEQETGTFLMTQVRRAEGPDWPVPDEVIAINPATAAVVTYWTGSTWATLSDALYAIVQVAGGIAIIPEQDAVWPTLPDKAGPRVRVDVTCGYGAAVDVPASLRLWIRAHVVAHINDQSATTDKPLSINPRMSGLLDPHRVYAR